MFQRIGLIDVDGHNFPNLPLMKISQWHKQQVDSVEWYRPDNGWYDKVYLSKVFSFTPDYEEEIHASEIERGGSGYCISLVNGKEVFDKTKDKDLPYEIEHIYPDYPIYYDKIPEVRFSAYGFMSRGCPRGCDFCHVKDKEGRKARYVAPLSEFWHGQKNIVLLDPNPIACKGWRDILQQLIDSKANVDFTQGVDIRIMTPEKAEMLKRIKTKTVHFAWDRYQDKDMIVPKFEMFQEITGWDRHKMTVYVLCNFDSTIRQDLERIYKLRDMGYQPFVMLYDKQHIPKGHILKKIQRWCNWPASFNSFKTIEEYAKVMYKNGDISY